MWMAGFSFPKFLIAMGPWMLGRNFLFHFNPFDNWYKCLVHRYLTRLIAFDYDKAGNLGNLSRIDPSLLSIKDANTYTKNTLYLHGFSTPWLCFSLVLVTGDNHEYGVTWHVCESVQNVTARLREAKTRYQTARV